MESSVKLTQALTRLLSSFLLVLILQSLIPCSRAHALPPGIHWQKIETPHFTVIFDATQYELATVYARSAEQAFAAVSPVFGLWPEKTVIILDDSTDIANGAATGFPYPLIIAYPVLPTSLDSVADYGNWGLELITHEYTHILNFEPASGWMKPLRYLFGSIVRPNILLPRWYSEGMAVDMETRFSAYGRLRSSNYLSIIRAMVEEGTLRGEDVSRINEVSIPDWPGGVRPYLMGALMMDELVRLKGIGILGELNTAYGRRIPFFISGPAKDRLGIGYKEVLEQAYHRAEVVAERQLTAIKSVPTQQEAAIKQDGFFNHSPVFSPDGLSLAYISRGHNFERGIFITRATKQTPPSPGPDDWKARGSMVNRMSWFPDSKRLVRDGIDDFDRDYQRSDLWIDDLVAKESKQITHGLRAHEPVVAPDGQSIVYVQITPGSTALAAVRADGSSPTMLYTPSIQTRVSRPEFLREGEIIFSERTDKGEEVLRVLRVRKSPDGLLVPDGEPHTVLAEYKPAHYPRMTKEGLLFVSDRSGVANLYLADAKLKKVRAVTNSTTRIMTGDLDPLTGELYYSKLVSKGPQIFRTTRASWEKVPAKPPQVEPLIDSAWPEFKPANVDVKVEREEYSPWWYLLPRYWMPNFYTSSTLTYISASTSAADPTGRHSYGLQIAYDTMTSSPSFYGTYTNYTTPVLVSLAVMNSYDYVYSLGRQRQFSDATLALGTYLWGLSNKWKGLIGWDASQMTIGGFSLKRSGPGVELFYNNTKQRGLEISPESGGSFSVVHHHYLPEMSDNEYDVTDIRLSKYLSGWILPDRHVLALFSYSSIAPRLNSAIFGVSSLAGNYQTLPGTRGVVMRGYAPGAFIGRTVYSATAEYRFPLYYSYRGFSTRPFFVQRWHGDIFVDALTLDGFWYDYTSGKYNYQNVGNVFYGTGLEVKLDTTVAYHLPIQFILGLYYGTDPRANNAGLFPMLSLGM